MKWFTLQSLKKKKNHFFVCVLLNSWKHLSSRLLSTTTFHPCLWLIYILLWWDIFFRPWRAPPPLHCAETLMLSCVLGKKKKKKPHHPAEERMTVGCWRTARWLFKHIIFTSPSDFWSMAFSVLAEFILFHSLSVGFMNFGWNNGTTDC